MDYSIPREILETARKPVFPHMVDGERVFVKKRRPGKNPLGRFVQRVLYRLTGNFLVMPPNPPTGDSVSFEVDALRRLGGVGIRVPGVLHVADGYFVMSDAGGTLEEALALHPERKAEYLEKALRELRRFHDLGFAHGGAQIRNLTLLNGEVHFIDFEESIPASRLERFQLRDVFLFLMSLERNGHDPDLAALCRIYDGGTDRGTMEGIRAALGKLRMLRILDLRLFAPIGMRDIRCLNHLIRKAGRAVPETDAVVCPR